MKKYKVLVFVKSSNSQTFKEFILENITSLRITDGVFIFTNDKDKKTYFPINNSIVEEQ